MKWAGLFCLIVAAFLAWPTYGAIHEYLGRRS